MAKWNAPVALQKQGVNIPFGQGLDTKTDPNQVQMGKFLVLENSVFNKGNLLQKRNGNMQLTTLPITANSTLTTFNDNMIVTGKSLYAYQANIKQWNNRGTIQPVNLNTAALARRATSLSSFDVAISDGLVCSTFVDSTNAYYYQISDLATGVIVVSQTALPATATMARVFVLGRYFIITFGATVSAAAKLRYISIPISMPTTPASALDISANIASITTGYDAFVANNNLYIAWNGNDGGGAIRYRYLTSTLVFASEHALAGKVGTLVSVTADTTTATPTVWLTYWNTSSGDAYTSAYSATFVEILAPVKVVSALVLDEITSIATSGVNTVYAQVEATLSYSSVRSDYVAKGTCTIAGVAVLAASLVGSVGLASKPFKYDSVDYMLVAFNGPIQPTYFLINSSGQVLLKLAYANGAGYKGTQILPSVYNVDDTFYLAYSVKDLLVSVNKTEGATVSASLYGQQGINLASITINARTASTSEIASGLHLTGGFVWQYDGNIPVEHGFHLYPENAGVSTATTGGLLTDQTYSYVFTYEWTDGQGLLHRSAPSIPINQVTAGGGTSTNTLKVPTLRLTYKNTTNNIRIVGYRWSTAQQNFYQFTSITSPTVNDTTTQFVTITDILADTAIIGNTLLYTTGGVLENIAAPACTDSTLWKSRMFVIDAENQNSLWYSKPVVEGVPVEFTDAQTIYQAPTTGSEGSTGKMKCVNSMDDKLILFKDSACYYMSGNGPDVTGANNDFNDPIFITATVGCNNPSSIVLTPVGLMFQSGKGIWLLGRDLSTSFIGAPVAQYNDDTVLSSVVVPGTNQVRFTLDSGVTLVYDYYYQQWSTFTGTPAICSTIYQGLHTYLDDLGRIFQENVGSGVDGSRPVLMKYTTAWIKLTDLQGYQRVYFMYMLANYLTPHKLNFQIAYDYNPSPSQSQIITPTNFSPVYGDDTLYGGGSPFGGQSNVEQWRLFFNVQQCQAIQVTMTEIYDPSHDLPAGAGLTISGLNFVIGAKSNTPKLPGAQSAG